MKKQNTSKKNGHPQQFAPKDEEIVRTIVRARLPLPLGVTLYLRGLGGGLLSWDLGIPMEEESAGVWKWETKKQFSMLEFKVVAADKIYEKGARHPLSFGSTIDYIPNF